VLATGARPGLIALQPWYRGPDARHITAAQQAASHRITTRAAHHPGGTL